jgi:hypothetical protein
MQTRLFSHLAAVVIGLALTSSLATAQVQWNGVYNYDKGHQQAVAIHPSGLVVEFHRNPDLGSTALYYHVGRLQGTTVNWAENSQRVTNGQDNVNGAWPNVDITQDGHVLFVWSTGSYKSSSSLRYQVGKIDPYGDTGQSIQWLSGERTFDAGFHSSTAMNDNGAIVEVHESGTGGSGLFYRVGHFVAGGSYNIHWDSGGNGIHYDDGINPHIAINNLNQVIEVHQVSRSYPYLHYHRGVLTGGIIDFGGSQRYNDSADDPSVALLDSGVVLELHVANNTSSEDRGAYALPGTLNPTNPDLIDWSDATRIDDRAPGETAVATDGTQLGPHSVVGTWPVSDVPAATIRLNYAVGTILEAAP